MGTMAVFTLHGQRERQLTARGLEEKRPGALGAFMAIALGRWWLVAPLSGGLAGLALPPLGWPPLLWLALAGLWGLVETAPPLPAGLLWGLAAIVVSHRWLLGLHPLDWIGVPAPLSLPLCLLLLLVCALAAGLGVACWLVLARRLRPRSPAGALLLASCWGLTEVALARGPLFWLGLGASALPGDRPLAGLASLGGAGLVAAVQLLIGWGISRCLEAKKPLVWVAITAAMVAASHGLGAGLLAAQPLEQGHGERLLVLQPAIPTREKFTWPQQQLLRARLRAALAEGAERQVASVLLPEGALALPAELTAPAAVELISGGFRVQQRQGEAEQRSALLRFPPGELQPSNWLDKHRLVPLGEWVPLAGLIRWSGLSAVGGLQPGTPSRLLTRPAGAIGGAICYELSDGQALARASAAGGLWLLASANLDPYPAMLQHQFAALAQLRAIESGRWLVSAANTGPSLLVNARGQVVAQLPAGRPSSGLFQIQQLSGLTIYDQLGEGPLLLLAALGAGGLLANQLRR